MTIPFAELLTDLEFHLTNRLVPPVDKSWLPIVFEVVQSAKNGRYDPADIVVSPNNVKVKAGQIVQFFKLDQFIKST
jgi:hypothetical protein